MYCLAQVKMEAHGVPPLAASTRGQHITICMSKLQKFNKPQLFGRQDALKVFHFKELTSVFKQKNQIFIRERCTSDKTKKRKIE